MQAGIRRVFGADLTADQVVARIIGDVRAEGERGLVTLRRGLRRAAPEVSRGASLAMAEALTSLDRRAARCALAGCRDKSPRSTASSLRTSWIDYSDEGALGQIVRPLDRVGVYTPGGTAVYPSSLLMTAIPARVAGVRKSSSVPRPVPSGEVSPLILAAAEVAEVDRLFAIGGAQAIAAMAYGTESIPHVDKIFGPGQHLRRPGQAPVSFGIVDIDQLPWPDRNTRRRRWHPPIPSSAAADILAQAEHDPMARPSSSPPVATLRMQSLPSCPRSSATLERAEIAGQSLATNGLVVVIPDVETAIDLANAYAPEHLCLLIHDPWSAVPLVRHAGGIFVGEDSPEALGDYTAGPSHVMPTGGTARFSSPIHVAEFTKVISVAAAQPRALRRLGPATVSWLAPKV